MSAQFVNCIVSTQNFKKMHLKIFFSLNRFAEIHMSVAWAGVGGLGWGRWGRWGHWGRGAGSFAWCSRDRGLLAVGQGVVCLLSCSIAE